VIRAQCRVRAAHRCTALPSEPCLRFSPHTAQATCPEDPSSPIAHAPKMESAPRLPLLSLLYVTRI
jgi:hypothetical protein